MAHDDTDINAAMLLQHMQGMEQRLSARIVAVDRKVDSLDAKLSTRIDRLERNLTTQIDSIDRRLDEIEIEKLPERVKRLERVVGIKR